MSAFTTDTIDRDRAEKLVMACRQQDDRSVKALTRAKLQSELDGYVDSGEYTSILGYLINYRVEP